MTIAPLATPYNGNTHARLVRIDLDSSPGVAHFRLGKFAPGQTPPPMPYNGAAAPAGWDERAELNTANLNAGVESLSDVVATIESELQAHA